jgi:agmatine/peptidylarginine deiminase
MDKRKKLIAIAVVGVVAISLSIMLKSTLAVSRAAQTRVSELESLLMVSDQNAAKSIEHAFARSEELTILLSRQQHPRTEWFYLLEELRREYTEFLANPHYESVLPHHTALSSLFLGRLLILQGNRDTAHELIEKSISLATKVGDATTVARANNTLGCLLATDGDYQPALAAFQVCSTTMVGAEGHENLCAIAMRNAGLVQRALGRDGTALVREAVALLERAPETTSWGFTSEILQDLRMTLCEVYWSQGLLSEAMELARQTRDDLESKFIQADLPGDVDKHILARNRLVTAYRLAQRNLEELQELRRSAENRSQDKVLGKTVSRWQWNPLFDATTELVSVDLAISGTMVGEFEPQSGLVAAWGTLEFNHSAILEIAKAVHNRTQLVIVSDVEESLEEARSALEEAGVPLSSVRFCISDCETPWFRDEGPIVSRSSTGDAIWFDSRLTRDDRIKRTVVDALPRTLRRNWKTRVVDTPIHLEGGMLLSNGKGLTIGAASIVTLNQGYGFSDQTITRELRRITGARKWHFVETLIGELTEHVDMFMTFVNPTTVVVGEYDDPTDPNAALLDETAAQLSKIIFDGKPLKVVRIPMPHYEAPYFPSYTNVIFANGVLLVPSYQGVPAETELRVKEIYEGLLPDWDVQFIDCSRLRNKGGALHCLVSNLGHTPFTPVFSTKQ